MAYTKKKKPMRARTAKRRAYRKYGKTYKKGIKDYIVRSTKIATPFPDEFICKVKSFIKFDLQGLGGAQTFADARFDNSIHDLGSYETGAGAAIFWPKGGVDTQEGVAQLNAMYNNYVVTGLKVDVIVENSNNHTLQLFSWPFYPGTNLTGPNVPFTTVVEDDPRVKRQYIPAANQGTGKMTRLVRYVNPQYAFHNGYIKGDKGWSALVAGDPSLFYGLAMRVSSVNQTSNIASDVHVTGYVTHYVKFFNKKNI